MKTNKYFIKGYFQRINFSDNENTTSDTCLYKIFVNDGVIQYCFIFNI